MRAREASFFENLFKQYYHPLYYFTFAIVNNKEVTEDIVMDAFNYVYHRLPELDIKKPLSGLLYKVCRTKSIDYIRTKKHEIPLPEVSYQFDSHEGEFFTDRFQRREELILRMQKVLADMPAQRKRVFESCFIAGKSYREVSQDLNISINTVKSHIIAALKTMREEFCREDLLLFYLWIQKMSGISI